jgi:hypothetical protein
MHGTKHFTTYIATTIKLQDDREEIDGLSQNGHSSSAIDEEGARAPDKTAIRDRSSSDGGYSIGCKTGDRTKESAATSRSFEFDSNVIDVSE